MKKAIVKLTIAAVLSLGFFGVVDGKIVETNQGISTMKVVDPGGGGR